MYKPGICGMLTEHGVLVFETTLHSHAMYIGVCTVH